MESISSLPRTVDLLSTCWLQAEVEVRRLIREKYTAHDEVFINRLLYGELSAIFRLANDQKAFADAILADLQPLVTSPELAKAAARTSSAVIARLSYHEPHVETLTTGDLGLTVTKPRFSTTTSGLGISTALHQQGLLCQAKRQSADGHGGRFTRRQEEAYHMRRSYLALLLYEYADTDRHDLESFKWKPCYDQELDELVGWLKSLAHSNTLDSATMLHGLGNGTLGTSDEATIRDIICPADIASFKVEITWPDAPPSPDDDPPPGENEWLKQLQPSTRKPKTYRPQQQPPRSREMGR